VTDESRKRRRRRRRIIASAAFLVISLTLAWIFESQSTTTVIFVRYADVNPGDESNPGLNGAGQRRAEELVRVIGDINVVASVNAIFATQFRNTQETAEPLAKSLQMPVQVIDADNVRGLTDLILQEYKGDIVLVITNRKALPQLIQRFHGSKNLPEIEDSEYDNLFIVSIPWYGKVKTLRLKYGAPFVADE
jgi:2,3-bisphosphoglycerate-dependent phosphoglycerate mutase